MAYPKSNAVYKQFTGANQVSNWYDTSNANRKMSDVGEDYLFVFVAGTFGGGSLQVEYMYEYFDGTASTAAATLTGKTGDVFTSEGVYPLVITPGMKVRVVSDASFSGTVDVVIGTGE